MRQGITERTAGFGVCSHFFYGQTGLLLQLNSQTRRDTHSRQEDAIDFAAERVFMENQRWMDLFSEPGSRCPFAIELECADLQELVLIQQDESSGGHIHFYQKCRTGDIDQSERC